MNPGTRTGTNLRKPSGVEYHRPGRESFREQSYCRARLQLVVVGRGRERREERGGREGVEGRVVCGVWCVVCGVCVWVGEWVSGWVGGWVGGWRDGEGEGKECGGKGARSFSQTVLDPT